MITVELKELRKALPGMALLSKNGLARIEARGKALYIQATDGETTYTRRVPLKTKGELAETAIGAGEINRLKLKGAKEVMLEREGDTLTASNGVTSLTFSVAQGITWPKAPRLPRGLVVDAKELKAAIGKVRIAATEQTIRYAMNGIHLEIKGKKRKALKLAATDGRRLAVANVKAEGELRECIFPINAVPMIAGLLNWSEGKAEIRAHANSRDIMVKASCGEVRSKEIEGRFPSYELIIPRKDETPISAELDREAFIVAMEAALERTDQERRGANLIFGPDGLIVKFGSENEQGTAIVKGAVSGELTICLNPSFLLDVLKVLPGEVASMHMSNPDSLVVFKSKGYGYYVMPISPRDY